MPSRSRSLAGKWSRTCATVSTNSGQPISSGNTTSTLAANLHHAEFTGANGSATAPAITTSTANATQIAPRTIRAFQSPFNWGPDALPACSPPCLWGLAKGGFPPDCASPRGGPASFVLRREGLDAVSPESPELATVSSGLTSHFSNHTAPAAYSMGYAGAR